MIKKSMTLPLASANAQTLLAQAYGALEALNWTIKYAGPHTLIAYTPKTLTRWNDQVQINTTDNELVITSSLIHGELFDLAGKNRKHIAKFVQAFNAIYPSTDRVSEWQEKIAAVQDQTVKTAQEQSREAAEVAKVMQRSKGGLYLTYGIIGVNVAVYIAMVAGGVDFFSPTGLDIIKWGANYRPLTTSGDWWRLISCVFVHIGLIHLLFNMYALFIIGTYLEPMLGRTKFLVAYLCTGVFASLASLWWHTVAVPSAGASGAIFGMYGVFLALLSTSLIPKQVRKSLLQSIGIFVIYNLAYGMKSGVDNAAHVGGLLSGLVIGYLYYFSLKKEDGMKRAAGYSIGVIIVTILVAGAYLQQHHVERTDTDKFSTAIGRFTTHELAAVNSMRHSDSLSKEESIKELRETALTNSTECVHIAEEMGTYKLSAAEKRQQDDLLHYAKAREELIRVYLLDMEANTNEHEQQIDSLNKEIGSRIERINEERKDM